mmetsp:Transcript_55356/g.152424  ORF Transcript_55356/g.152424 Transcript_55356/m.152424 type:complete len:231 (+) Transcript_55356:3021-3713(+)
MSVRLEEGGARLLARGVEHGAVGEHDPHVRHRVVRVLGDAAAHAARVVRDNPTNHAAVDRGRVGPNLVLRRQLVAPLVRREQAVHLATDHTRLHGNLATLVRDLHVAPVAPGVVELDQNRVRYGLPRQRGARRAEGDRRLEFGREPHHLLHLLLVVDLDHSVGDEAVERRVRAVGKRAHGVRDNALLELGYGAFTNSSNATTLIFTVMLRFNKAKLFTFTTCKTGWHHHQ